jgi:squalene-hopene/tetraprenyl-beta-curcumene cyclase
MTSVSYADITTVIKHGAEALLRRQRPDGAFDDDPPASVLGTAGAVAALNAADPLGSFDLIEAGTKWLREQQQDDGGWSAVVGAASEVVPTAIAVATLAMSRPANSAEAIAAGRRRLAAFGGVDAVTDPDLSLLCRQLLMISGLTGDAGPLRQLPVEAFFNRVRRRRRLPFRIAPFTGLALMQTYLLPAAPLRRATLRRTRTAVLRLLRSVYDHEGRTGALGEDPWPTALVLLGLTWADEAPDIARAIVGWLRRVVRPDGSWDAVANLDLTRSGYAVTGLLAAGYAADPRLQSTRAFLHACRKAEAFPVLDVPPGGWSYSNVHGWPATFESAEILSALAGYQVSFADPVLREGLEWLIGRQDTQGSWSLWVRDAKFINDGPCPAVTSQAINALHHAGHADDHPAIASASAWLLNQQNPEGTFNNLLYRDHTAGTAAVVGSLSRVGHARHSAVRRAVGWLHDTQLPDGSWGPGDGTAGSVEETAWAVQGLLAADGPETTDAVDRGVAWLLAAARPDGEWRPTRVCNYIRHHIYYPNWVITQATALRALGEYREPIALRGMLRLRQGHPRSHR